MTRRNLELLLLCIAAPLVILMFAMLALNEGETLGLKVLAVPIGIFFSFVVAHIAVRRFAPNADPAILPIVFALSGIGIAFVTRLAPDLAINQVVWLFAGVVGMILVLAFSHNLDRVGNYKYTLMLFGFLLLLSPMIPGLGQEIYGSRIWLSLGPFSFQPGEIAKIVIVLFLAGYLAENREMLSVFTWRVGPFHLPDLRTIMPVLLMWLMALVVVVFEKDLGSAVVFFFVFLAMLYCATGKKFYLIVGILLMLVGCVFAYLFFSHVQVRVQNWLDPFSDAQGTGYQLVQSLYSIADGDLFGVGIGRGLASQIPVVESDFIFAAIAEECGLLGAAGVLLLFLSLAVRGFVTAARAKSDLSSFVAVGLTTVIVLQAFIIVGGVTRLIPLTGLTLPFISQGGSSLLASFLSVGFLLRCGDEGTGVDTEMTNGGKLSVTANGVLGRVALGKRLTMCLFIFCALFALLVANLTMIMVVQAKDYQSMPGNNHTIAKEATVKRGTISTYDGTVLAESEENSDGTYDREYPAGDLASQVVGYYSSRYGTSGIEGAENDALTGSTNYASWVDVLNQQAGINQSGNDVVLTINSTIQQAAQDALSGFTGACIVIDPNTGAVLAMASSPTYDASDFETQLQEAADGETTSDNSALLNRATQSLYAPGSTFKMVTLSAALENNIASESTVYEAPGTLDIGGGKVTNYNSTNYGSITLSRATQVSSNTVFGQVGVQLGANLLVQQAEKFGFDNSLNFELPTATSIMSNPDDMDTWETAWAAAGQPVGDEANAGPQATVLQMAMVGCAVANDGTLMNPYIVDGIYNSIGERSYTASPSTFQQAISAETAKRVRSVLTDAVNNGTGAAAKVSGVQVAGKTGTAETGKPEDDSWFVGMAPANDPQVVVAIVLEQAATEESGAARAQNVLETALQEEGLL
ncbi:MAG: FtsW/RodA/SpoVE family cell cycle protein [Eggerthellaceae bacterium]|jgi:cell division protein FtsW (lipid II flippase)/cell division protein FtsI/penicillin-binding protein 2